jgi:uncharacterized protein (TIGR04255 family)
LNPWQTPHPEFGNPPLIEVVFGVQFEELDALKALHLGTFWEEIGKDAYPGVEEKPPLAHQIEQPFLTESPAVEIKRYETPPLSRYFFTSKDQTRLIQIQSDRFHQNWRKFGQVIEYPKYETLCPQFMESWDMFHDFVEDRGLGQLQPDQYELTYVNHIEQGEAWANEKDIEKVFPWFKCDLNSQVSDALERVAWRRIYRLPDQAGRLHVAMQQAVTKDRKIPVLLLNITARGFAEGNKREWFDMAHEWIVRTFVDLTGSSVQETVWKKR